MSDDSIEPRVRRMRLQEEAFPTSLPLVDVATKYWFELKKILPAEEVLIIDPYLLDAGGVDPKGYSNKVASLLVPALQCVQHLVLVHGKPRPDVQNSLQQSFRAISPDVPLTFHRGEDLHSRYLVADRERAIRMEFSFNRIGRVFGTVSVVTNGEDRGGILNEVERLYPRH